MKTLEEKVDAILIEKNVKSNLKQVTGKFDTALANWKEMMNFSRGDKAFYPKMVDILDRMQRMAMELNKLQKTY